MQENLVECRNITKTFMFNSVKTEALKGIDLDIYKGELLMLAGPSGCGKTTLISILAGILNYDQGECRLIGKELKTLTDNQKTKYRGENIGFVFQSFNLIPTLTVFDNVSIPLVLLGADSKEIKRRTDEVLSAVGIPEKAQVFPRNLSGGQQQRVAIARALVHSPKLVVCDEPTSALDAVTGKKIMDLFSEIARTDDKTLIIVTHDNRIFSYADRIAIINDGLIEKILDKQAVSQFVAGENH